MITIEVLNHKCILKGLDNKADDLVEKASKIFIRKYMPGAFGGQYDVYKLYNREESSIPRGFQNEIEEVFKKNHIKYEIVNKEKLSSNTYHFSQNNDLPKLRPWQKSCLKLVDKNNQGIIAATTGTGKSRVILETVLKKQALTLIVVPTESIKNGLENLFSDAIGSNNVTTESISKNNDYIFNKDEDPDTKLKLEDMSPSRRLRQMLNDSMRDKGSNGKETNMKKPAGNYLDKFKKKEVLLDDSEEIEFLNTKKFYKDKKNDPYSYDKKKLAAQKQWKKKVKPVTIICANSLANISEVYLKMVELLIIDECHTGTTSWVRNAVTKMPSAGYRYFFSATPWRDMAGQMKLLLSVIGTNLIYEYRGKEAADDETIARPAFKMINAPQPTTYVKNIKNRRDIIEVCIIGNATRNNRIVEEAMEQYNNDKNIFIAVDEISHLEILKEKFKKLNVEVVIIHGELPSFEKEQKIQKVGKHKGAMITIGTMAVGIGTDMPEINVVIIASSGKSTIRFLQRIGRGSRRTSASFLVIDFFDWFHPKLMDYSKSRMRTFNSEYKNPKELMQFIKATPDAALD